MIDLRPLHDRVVGHMLEIPGTERRTTAGLIITETESSDDFVRPRWFKVTGVGPKQLDILPGQYVLVAHGRWSRGVDVNGTLQDKDKLFLIDHNDILGTSDENPIN